MLADFNLEAKIRPVFFKFLLAQSSPFATSILFSLIFYLKQSFMKNDKSQLKFKIATIWILVFYLLYPSYLMSCLELFKCFNLFREDTPIYYLENDYDFECWTTEHRKWMGISMGFLFIWIIVIPLILFIIWKKNNKKLTQYSYFILLGDFKLNFSYWELINFLKKIAFGLVIV
jgi:hypothetical protein